MCVCVCVCVCVAANPVYIKRFQCPSPGTGLSAGISLTGVRIFHTTALIMVYRVKRYFTSKFLGVLDHLYIYMLCTKFLTSFARSARCHNCSKLILSEYFPTLVSTYNRGGVFITHYLVFTQRVFKMCGNPYC